MSVNTESDQQPQVAPSDPDHSRKIRKRARARRGARLHVVDSSAADASSVPESATRVVWRFVHTRSNHAWAGVLRVGRRLAASSPYTGRPASIRNVVEYTRTGGWVPGEHGQTLESFGYLYGVVVAIPLTMILNSLCWILQKFTRVAFVALIAWLLSLFGVQILTWVVAYWMWCYVALIVSSCTLVFPLPKRET